MPPRSISLIAAMSRNRAIGRGNQLPWHLPADLKFFKQKTLDHTIILGRKTFESFGRPLPRRRHIVITRDPAWQFQGVETAHSLEEALCLAENPEQETLIAGGEQIYRLALPVVQKIYLSLIDTTIEEADAFFPELDDSHWQLTGRTDRPADAENAFAIRFLTYERKQK